MPTINGISISDSRFTAMQELATAFICRRAFKDDKSFWNAEMIVNDDTTRKGLNGIFKEGSRQVFNFQPLRPGEKLNLKSTEGKWINTFYLQQKKLLVEFSPPQFKVFNRQGGFMKFISDLVKNEFGISSKDTWNPADIWLIRKKDVYRKKIKEQLNGPSKTQTISELNAILRDMFKRRDVVGISLKLISGNVAKYEEINVSDDFFAGLGKDNYNFKLSKIVCKLGLKSDESSFDTQDTIVFLKDRRNTNIAKFQIKGNTSSSLSNLKFEGTEIGAAKARLGKAPLHLVAKLSKPHENLYNSSTKQWQNYPKTAEEFETSKEHFMQMFSRIIKHKEVENVGVRTEEEFANNMGMIFSGEDNAHIANSKLMQMQYIDQLLKMKVIERDEYLTDLLFIAQKKGRKVFDFGPFGKLY